MPKVTAGEWKISPAIDYAFKSSHATHGIQIVNQDGTVGIAQLNNYNKSDEEIIANARILSASKKLYVALKRLLHDVEHGNGSAAWDESKEKAHAALAEAEGDL